MPIRMSADLSKKRQSDPRTAGRGPWQTPATKVLQMKPDRVLLLTTGGTIDKIYFDSLSEYQVGPPGIERLLQRVRFVPQWRVCSLIRKDSLDLTESDRQLIRETVQTAPESRVLITHGTDTMAQTAQSLLGIPDRIIVLTGAMQPAGFHDSDADFNVAFALGALQSLTTPGVWIAMNGQLLAAGKAHKNRELGIFELLPHNTNAPQTET